MVLKLLEECQCEPRALGRSDYPRDFPLREVVIIARHCSGGIILGFEQFRATAGQFKPGTKSENPIAPGTIVSFPTPWNQLEAGILFGLRLPLLIFREASISGGVFDPGVTDVFVHAMPPGVPSGEKMDELRQVFLKWLGAVSEHYHRY